MDDRARRAVAVAGLVFALGIMLWRGLPTHPQASDSSRPATAAAATESIALRLRVVRLGGGTEDFELMPSGRVTHKADWDSRDLHLPPENIRRLERELLACGVCSLEPAEPLPAGPSRRRIDIEVLTQPQACSANLPWEKWHEDKAARVCLEAIRTALQPLVDQCGECTVP